MIKTRCFAALCALVLLVAPVASAGQNGAKAKAQPQKELTDADIPRISVDELILMLAKKKPVLIIDVRAPDTFTEVIKGAIQIPFDQVEARMKEIPRNKEIVTYCA